jgi:hypothetical protein
MEPQDTVTDRILHALGRVQDCDLEDLVLRCSDFTLQEVLVEVNRLCQWGQVLLTPKGALTYTVRLAA